MRVSYVHHRGACLCCCAVVEGRANDRDDQVGAYDRLQGTIILYEIEPGACCSHSQMLHYLRACSSSAGRLVGRFVGRLIG